MDIFCSVQLCDITAYSVQLQTVNYVMLLGRIQDLTKGGSHNGPSKAVAPKGVWGLPWKIFNFMASEMRFPAFSVIGVIV